MLSNLLAFSGKRGTPEALFGYPAHMSESPAEIWTEAFRVHSYEVDFEGRATLETLCHYFQEAAWNHAERLGVGYSHLQREQRLWVLSRLLIKIDGYPLWGDAISVRTWP